MADTADYKKPIPIPDETSKPFFDGARQHTLLLQHCTSCGAVMWPVKPRCDNCWSADLQWLQASGKGTLYSFTLMHQVLHPGFAGDVPYNIAEVDLEEKLRIITSIIGCSNTELQIGMPLEVAFDDITDEVSLLKFKPAR